MARLVCISLPGVARQSRHCRLMLVLLLRGMAWPQAQEG